MKAFLLPALAALPLAAHTYPVTLGTFTALPGGARFKLRLSAHHVHPALERLKGGRVALRDGEAYDPALLTAYFDRTLALLGPKGEVLRFTLVKQDLDPTDLVVTLEVLVDDLNGWRLQNTVLMELSRRQKNLVTVEGLGERRSLVFDGAARVLPLVSP